MHFLPREIPAAMHVVKERTLTIGPQLPKRRRGGVEG